MILREPNVAGIQAIIDVAGQDKAARFVKKAAELYQAGLMTQDGQRKRTLGGCFFFAAKRRLSLRQRRRAGLLTRAEGARVRGR